MNQFLDMSCHERGMTFSDEPLFSQNSTLQELGNKPFLPKEGVWVAHKWLVAMFIAALFTIA
jgi:hypothetical protein